MKRLCKVAAIAAPLVLAAPGALAQLQVNAQANIFGATHTIPPAPGGGGPGMLPVEILLGTIRGGTEIVFPAVTGLVSPLPGTTAPFNGPDGRFRPLGTDIFSVGGIAGLINRENLMFLAGVFTTDAPATDPAPERLDTTGLMHSEIIAPKLHQTFFIGDGLTGTDSGLLQRFQIPADATRLFLGFADAFWFGTVPGDPTGLAAGSYEDNQGTMDVTYSIVPTPGSAALLVAIAARGLRRRR